MRARSTTPPGGTLAAAVLESSTRITVRAKGLRALISAAARTVAAIKLDQHPCEPVLVVYADDAATVFCEQGAPSVKPGPQR